MNMELAERLSSVGEYYFSKKLREIDQLRASGKQIISLGIGGPDTPPHPSVIETLAREAANPSAHSYQSYKGAPVLRQAMADWYMRKYGVQLDPDTEILPLIGSKEGLMHICMTYLNKGDKALVPNPGYPTYRSAVSLAGGECVDYLLSEAGNWQPDLEQLERDGVQGVKLMFINYPHMPTGTLAQTGLFERLVAFARRHAILLVHDNPYSFIRNATPRSLLAVEGAKEVALELNSLSKSHSMAGWRIGMIAGDQARINEVLRFKSNMDSGSFLPMQLAAAVALNLGDQWYEQLNNTYYERQSKVYEIMEILGCSYAPNQAGLFVWGRLPEEAADCYDFIDNILYNKGIFITPGGIFGSQGQRYIRISLCANVQTLQKAIDILKA